MFDYILRSFSDETILTVCLEFVGMGFGVGFFISMLLWSVFSIIKFIYNLIRP